MIPKESYCVKCKTKTKHASYETITTKRGSPVLKAKCIVCGFTKYQIMKKTEVV